MRKKTRARVGIGRPFMGHIPSSTQAAPANTNRLSRDKALQPHLHEVPIPYYSAITVEQEHLVHRVGWGISIRKSHEQARCALGRRSSIHMTCNTQRSMNDAYVHYTTMVRQKRMPTTCL